MATVDDLPPLPPEEFERLPRHDIDLEMHVLGAAMLSQDAAVTAVERLTVEDFFRPAHRVIFLAIQSLTDQAEPVSALSVRLEMERLRDGKEFLPDGNYLHSLMATVPVTLSAGSWATKLQNVTQLRLLEDLGPSIVQTVRATAIEDADAAVERTQKLIEGAIRTKTISTAKSAANLIVEFMDRLESGEDQRGVTTGWQDMDALLGKLRPGQMIIVAGRPGMGKSAAMACLAHHVGIKLGLPLLIGTLEMSNEEFMARLVSIDCQVPLDRLLDGKKLTDADWQRLGKAHSTYAAAEGMLLDDEPGMGIGHIRARLRAMRRAGNPPALAIVDYLQLMEAARKSENRQLEVSGFSRSLKLMAKEFQIPVVVGAQLNRDVEKRHDKKPVLSDLRESGSLENDADAVILLHREDYYEKETPRAGEIDMIVAKNRSGPQATITAAFQGHYSRIVDMASEDRVPDYVDPSMPRAARDWQ